MSLKHGKLIIKGVEKVIGPSYDLKNFLKNKVLGEWYKFHKGLFLIEILP